MKVTYLSGRTYIKTKISGSGYSFTEKYENVGKCISMFMADD